MGAYALHVNCPWRLVTPEKIITGSSDYWQPSDWHKNSVSWEKEGRPTPHLQEKRILELFLGYDPDTKSCENITSWLVVEKVDSDNYGGVEIYLTGNYRLQLFPDSTDEDPIIQEEWRLLEPYGVHFVLRPNGVLERQEPIPEGPD